MSEEAPKAPVQEILPDMANNPEGLPPRDEAIDTIKNEISTLQSRLDEAEEKVRTPGFNADANDIVAARGELRGLRENEGVRLNALREMWSELGGEEIESAQTAVDNLNFKSDASDRTAANLGLRDAKDAFYARLEEGMRERETTEELSMDEKLANILEAVKRDPEAAARSGILDRLNAIRDAASAPVDDRSVTPEGYEADNVEAIEEAKSRVTSDDLESAHGEAVEEQRSREPATAADIEAAHVEAIEEDKSRVTPADLEAAHIEAIEEAKTRVTAEQLEDAHGEAIEEAKTRVTPAELEAAHVEAIEEAKTRVTPEQLEEAHGEAIQEDAERAKANKWWRRGLDRLTTLYIRGGEGLRQASNRNKLLGAVALAGAAYLFYKGYDLGQDGGSGGGGGAGGLEGDGGGVEDNTMDTSPDSSTNAPESGDTGGGAETAPDVSNLDKTATYGEGWLHQLEQWGFTSEEAQRALPKLLNSTDPEISSWVYRMDDGNPGISHPGTFSDSVVQSVMKYRS